MTRAWPGVFRPSPACWRSMPRAAPERRAGGQIGRASCRERVEGEVDGIRDGHVTGVQTCALPIFPPDSWLLQVNEALVGAEVACVTGAPAGLAATPVADDAGLAGGFPAVPGMLAEHAASSAGKTSRRADRKSVV